MDSSNTVEAISTSVSMQNEQHTLPMIQPSSDAFFSLQLADYLDNHQPPPSPPHDSTTTINNHTLPPLQISQINNDDSSSDDESTTGSTLLWVPADRHPEIAPSEFTKWLETNGTNTLTRKASSLQRKSSVLSHIHIPSDTSDTITTATTTIASTNPDDTCPEPSTLPNHDQQETSSLSVTSAPSLEFDRHSPLQDTSRVLVPPRGNPSLLRRKAFSARGRGRKPSQSRHGQHQQSDSQQQSMDSNDHIHPTMEPVRLYDRPVSMNEWIDLGSASLGCSSSDDSQQGILSRVHDAESQLLSQLTPELNPSSSSTTTISSTSSVSQLEATTPIPKRRHDHNKKDDTPENTVSVSYHNTTTTTTRKKSAPSKGIQRASSERISNKLERKSSTSSWFGNLFGSDKEKKRGSLRRVEDEKYAQKKQQQQQQQQQQSSPPPTPTPTRTNKEMTRTTMKTGSGLSGFFSRNNNGQPQQHHKRLLKFQQQVLSGVTAPLLLGKPSFSKTIRPPPSPPLEDCQKQQQQQQQQQQQPMVYHSYRLPIHVERAIYRLSHYKLADPRRPLQHQVVISNLMFWYLSVINAQQQPSTTLLSNMQQNTPASTLTSNNSNKNTILSSTTTSNNTLHAHFDDDTTSPSKNEPFYKGQKSGRIGIPKPRPLYNHSNNNKRTLRGVNDIKDNNDDNSDDDDDDGDDDLPLSYYKQTTL